MDDRMLIYLLLGYILGMLTVLFFFMPKRS